MTDSHRLSLLFDEDESLRRKAVGMQQAAESRKMLLAQAQLIAHNHARIHGTVTSDDVAHAMYAQGYDYAALRNAAGSVFKGLHWNGTVRKSIRPSTHARIIRVWTHKQQETP